MFEAIPYSEDELIVITPDEITLSIKEENNKITISQMDKDDNIITSVEIITS